MDVVELEPAVYEPDIECLIAAAKALRVPLVEDQVLDRAGSFDPAIPYRRLAELAVYAGMRADLLSLPSSLKGRCVIAYLDGRFVIVEQVVDKMVSFRTLENVSETMPLRAFRRHRVLVIRREHRLSYVAKTAVRPWVMVTVNKYRKRFVEFAGLSIVVQFLGLLPLFMLQLLIDKVIIYHATSTLVVVIVGFILMGVTEIILDLIRSYLLSFTTSRIDLELRSRMFSHLMHLPMSWFGSRDVGTISARIREIETISGTLVHGPINAVVETVFSCVFVLILLSYSWVLCLIHFAAMPLYLMASLILTPMTRSRLGDKFRRSAETQAFLVEALSGIETIKCAAIEKRFIDRYGDRIAALASGNNSASEITNISVQISKGINKISVWIIMFLGAMMAMNGDLTVGQFIAFNMFSNRLSAPMLRLVQYWQDLQTVRTHMDRSGDIVAAKPEEGLYDGRSHAAHCDGNIELRNVSFRYRPRGRFALNNVNLKIPAGQIVGIIGRTGSGKSSLAKMVLRQYKPENGNILLDGKNLATMDVAWVRRQIGFISPNTFLFDHTVRENIALRDPEMPLEQVEQAAKIAGAHDFIVNLPSGYDTRIGERGHTLSDGERQRICIAQGIATNPRILILDEATNALDFQTEEEIQSRFRDVFEARTVLIISHRYVTVKAVDRIVTMHDGRILEDGKPDELRKKSDGFYARLHAAHSQANIMKLTPVASA